MNNKCVPILAIISMLIGCATKTQSFEIGEWRTVSEASCSTYTFYENSTLKVVSGEQRLIQGYLISDLENSDFKKISMIVVENNGKPNCLGRLDDELGSELNIYIRPNAKKDEIYFYFTPQESGLVETIYLKKK